jgi:hypothetical protein
LALRRSTPYSGENQAALPPAWFRLLVPSATDLIFILLLVAMTAGVLAPRLLGDASIGWHIRNGELMLHSHAITRTDPFSVTMGGQPWYAWEWLYDLKFAAIHHWFGLNGVVFFSAVIIAATFALTLRLALKRSADLPVAALLLALALGASTIHLLARPHVLSWLLTVIWFQLLDSGSSADFPERSRRLWCLPALMLLWVNLHGGIVVGLVLLGLYLLSDAIQYVRCGDGEERRRLAMRLRQLGAVTAASVLVSLINPYGYKLQVHVYRYLSDRWLMNHIDEFLSPNFHGIAQQCFVAILLITIVALAMVRNKPPLSRLLVILFAAYSGLYASRSLPVSSLLLTLIVGPVLTQAIVETSTAPELSSRLRSWFAHWEGFASRVGKMETRFSGHLWPLVALVLGILVCANQGKLGKRQWMDSHFDAQHFPVQASAMIIQRDLSEPIFAPDVWGGYLIYRLYPQTRVFVDDRHDLYGADFLKDYLRAIRLTPDWNKFLNEKRVNWVLVPTESALANMLEETSEWSVAYRDRTAVLFSRKQRV